ASPMIPGLNDAEMEKILEEAAKAGATSAYTTMLRLPHELGALFTDWLHKYLPERAAHVLSLIRQSRAGQLNDSQFHTRFAGTGPYAGLMTQRFTRAVQRLGLNRERYRLDASQFRVPGRAPASLQMNLF
ncbi:MAG: radical SAM protein, partial [Rhodospirillales bacterium]|nr:radical SAM protein [Rhodospirillales bacterium]